MVWLIRVSIKLVLHKGDGDVRCFAIGGTFIGDGIGGPNGLYIRIVL